MTSEAGDFRCTFPRFWRSHQSRVPRQLVRSLNYTTTLSHLSAVRSLQLDAGDKPVRVLNGRHRPSRDSRPCFRRLSRVVRENERRCNYRAAAAVCSGDKRVSLAAEINCSVYFATLDRERGFRSRPSSWQAALSAAKSRQVIRLKLRPAEVDDTAVAGQPSRPVTQSSGRGYFSPRVYLSKRLPVSTLHHVWRGRNATPWRMLSLA